MGLSRVSFGVLRPGLAIGVLSLAAAAFAAEAGSPQVQAAGLVTLHPTSADYAYALQRPMAG